MKYYVVKYTGQFGFIKPWTAVRDSETFSQQFLTPSIVEGIEKKLFPELLEVKGIHKIKRHRLNYLGIDVQQERTWSKGGFKAKKKKDSEGNVYYVADNLAIINRGVMLEPNLYLAFADKEDAVIASKQHICLCRNEDVLFPLPEIEERIALEFDEIEGFELLFDAVQETMFKVGHNRFAEAAEMYGHLSVFGNPIRQNSI